ncbi:MAG: MFS transporter [Oscillospiraceae bacterium]|nr:MFS transporter [Oscillospiraceae bacterium]
MENNKLVRWPKLVIGVVILLFAGIIYAWSIIKAPFVSMWDSGQLALNYTLTIIFFCLGGFFSGLISKKTSAMFRLIVSAALLFAGFFITSFIIGGGGSIVVLYLAYGILAGTGIGFAYNTVISATNAWFPDKKGLCSGILLMGFGLSLLVIGNLADALGKAASIGWKTTYIILAIAIGVILLAAAFLVKPPPQGTVFPAPKASKKKQKSEAIKDYTALEMIKRPSFILAFIFITLVAASGSAALGVAKDIIIDVGAKESFAVMAVGLLGIFNGLGRLTSGWLFDNLGIRKTQFISSAVSILAPLTVVLALSISGQQVSTLSMIVGIIGVCLCVFSYGFAPTTGSVFAAEFYGPKNFPLNFSILNLILIPAPFAATLAGSIKAATGEFRTAFIILAAGAAVGFLVNLGIKKP